MNFFTFSGIDGSGKTTQLGLIIEHLESKQFKVATFHLVEYSIANKIRSLLRRNGQQKSAAVTNASFFTSLLRKIFIMIDVFRFKFHFRSMQKQGYDILITDRYFYDQIVNILYLDEVFDVSVLPFWARIVQFFMIKPTKSFYMDVSPQTALARDKEIEQGARYLSDKKIIFDMLAPKWKMIRIDANQDIAAVNDIIIRSL